MRSELMTALTLVLRIANRSVTSLRLNSEIELRCIVAWAFQPAGSGDFPVAFTKLESFVNPQTRMSALQLVRKPFRVAISEIGLRGRWICQKTADDSPSPGGLEERAGVRTINYLTFGNCL